MPRIYVASLSDYNAGHLHGRWIDLDGLDASDDDAVMEDIAAMLRASQYPNITVECPDCDGTGRDKRVYAIRCQTCSGAGSVPSAEEWAVHDYDDLPSSFGEHPDLSALLDYVAMIGKHGEDWRAYVEHCEDIGAEPTESHFDDCRAGTADTELAWCEEFLEETGTISEIPANLRSYFDTEAYLRDMKLSGDVDFVEREGTTYAFWRH